MVAPPRQPALNQQVQGALQQFDAFFCSLVDILGDAIAAPVECQGERKRPPFRYFPDKSPDNWPIDVPIKKERLAPAGN